MTDVNLTRTAPVGLVDRLSVITAGVRDALHRRSVYRQTLRELNALTDRDLTDLGLHKANIPAIAREAAWGK